MVNRRLQIDGAARVLREVCTIEPSGNVRHRFADVVVANVEELAELRRKPGYVERAIEEHSRNARRLEQLPQYLRELAELVDSLPIL
jgi:hypothetical protein